MEKLKSDFLKQYQSGQNIFALLNDIFLKASIINPINGINNLFFSILRSNTYPLELIKKMVELGADPHYKNDSPFVVSCAYDIIDVPLYFIKEHNIDINVHNESIGFSCRNIDVLKMLLENGLQITDSLIKNQINNTDQSLELLYLHNVSLEKLMLCFLDLRVPNYNDDIVCFFIDKIEMNESFIQSEILNNFLINTYQYLGLTLQQIKILIRAGADPRYKNDAAFVISCMKKSDDLKTTIYFLHECGANINANHSYALECAINNDRYETAKFLIESGINVVDHAIKKSYSDKKYLELFINNGIDADRIAKLYIITLADSIDFAKALIKNGVDLNQYILNH